MSSNLISQGFFNEKANLQDNNRDDQLAHLFGQKVQDIMLVHTQTSPLPTTQLTCGNRSDNRESTPEPATPPPTADAEPSLSTTAGGNWECCQCHTSQPRLDDGKVVCLETECYERLGERHVECDYCTTG
jgi:hypothetical protein